MLQKYHCMHHRILTRQEKRSEISEKEQRKDYE